MVLPEDVVPDGTGNPLHNRPDFLNVACPTLRDRIAVARPTRWTPSSTRRGTSCATATRRTTRPWSARKRADYWMPMDQYIGGIEHAILHLLYARFWTKVMRDLKLVTTSTSRSRGCSRRAWCSTTFIRVGQSQRPASITSGQPMSTTSSTRAARCTGALLKSDGSPVDYEGVGTMSKSKNNGVDPQQLIDRYGADTARLFVMFASPPEQTLEWNDAGVEGANRFLRQSVGLRRQAWRGDQGRRPARVVVPASVQCDTAKALRRGGSHHLAAGQLRLRAHAVQHRRLRRHEAC